MLRINNLSGFGKVIGGGSSGVPPDYSATSGAISYISGTSLTVSLPTHAAGDILFVAMWHTGGTGTPAATGWNLITSNNNDANTNAWFWKRAASDSETIEVTWNGSTYQAFGIGYTFTGCVASGTPYEDATRRDYSSSSQTTPFTSAIDTLGDARLAVCLSHNRGAATYSVSPPPGVWTDGGYVTTTDGVDGAFQLLYKDVPSMGSVAAEQIGTYNAGTYYYESLTFALIPA